MPCTGICHPVDTGAAEFGTRIFPPFFISPFISGSSEIVAPKRALARRMHSLIQREGPMATADKILNVAAVYDQLTNLTQMPPLPAKPTGLPLPEFFSSQLAPEPKRIH